MRTLLTIALLILPLGAEAKVLMVGDSLSVGTKPYLEVETYAKISLSLEAGMKVWRNYPAPQVSAFSLFTNNHPRQVSKLEQAVKESLAGSRCVVWATIQRPAANGVSYQAANQLLRSYAQRNPSFRLVDWKAQTEQRPELLAGDRIHATPEGYRVRARLYRDAISSCGERPSSPPQPRPASPRYTPPASQGSPSLRSYSPKSSKRVQDLRRSLKRQAIKRERKQLERRQAKQGTEIPPKLAEFIRQARYWNRAVKASQLIDRFYKLLFGSYN